MTESATHVPTEAEKRAIAKLRNSQPSFRAFRAAAATEKRREEEEKARIIAALKVGDVMPDGSIYAGITPDTNKRMYAMPRDASIKMAFEQAAVYTENLTALGHYDWRVPTKEELNVLFENREKGALRGTFNSNAGAEDGSWYLSSSPDVFGFGGETMSQRFSDGRVANTAGGRTAVRLIRLEPSS